MEEFKKLFKRYKTPSHREWSDELTDLLYDFVLDLLARKDPAPQPTKIKAEQIAAKIRLVESADGIIDEDYEEIQEIEGENGELQETKVPVKANTKHSSVLYIKINQYELEQEIPIEVTSNKDQEPGAEGEGGQTKTVIKLVDEDQQGKVL